MSILTNIAALVGETAEQKRVQYGDSVGTSAAALTLLFPHGIPAERFDQALLIVRVWDKLQRLATGADPQGENPWLDVAGYGICGVAQATQRQRERMSTGCGSANGEVADAESTAPNVSAAPNASAPTMPSASERKDESAPTPLLKESRSGSASTDAVVPNAQETAHASAAVRARKRNSLGLCANAPGEIAHPLSHGVSRWILPHFELDVTFCSRHCALSFQETL